MQQAGFGVAGEDVALDPDDGADMTLPVGAGEPAGGFEGGDAAAFVTIAADVVAVGGGERRRGRAEVLDMLEQGWLVVLDLDDQGDAGVGGDFEMFF